MILKKSALVVHVLENITTGYMCSTLLRIAASTVSKHYSGQQNRTYDEVLASSTLSKPLLVFSAKLSELVSPWLKSHLGLLIVNFQPVFEFSTSSLFLVWPASLTFYDNLGLETFQPLAPSCSTNAVHSTELWSASGVETDKWASASGVVELPISSRGQNNEFCWKLDTSGVEKVSVFN